MSGKFAAHTDVPVAKSRAEIEGLIERYGATGFMSGWQGNRATVQFRLTDRYIRFVMELPDPSEDRFTLTRINQFRAMQRRSPDAARKAWEQACRQKWRVLALLVKAKLEAVDAKIATLEEAFFADIVLPDGLTVYEKARDQVALAYAQGASVPLLPGMAQ